MNRFRASSTEPEGLIAFDVTASEEAEFLDASGDSEGFCATKRAMERSRIMAKVNCNFFILYTKDLSVGVSKKCLLKQRCKRISVKKELFD